MKKIRIFGPARSFAAALVLTVLATVFAAGCFITDQLDSVKWTLKTIENNYYFYDDFNAEGAENLTPEEIAARLDIYSEYYTREEYEAVIRSNSGEKSGVGISYNFIEGKGAYLVTVTGSSPADAAGLTAGDLIVAGRKNGAEVAFENSKKFTQFIDGCKTGEKFTLISSDGGEYELSREAFTASYTFYATNRTAWKFLATGDKNGLALVEDRDAARGYLPDGAAYVRLSQFYGSLAEEFGRLMSKFNAEKCTSLIIDLRNNGGGYVSAMQDIAGYFTSSLGSQSQVAMTAEYKNGKKELYNCYPHNENTVPADTDIYVLVNSGTASASEALIGVLVSYGLLDYPDIFISDFGEDYVKWAGNGVKNAQSYGKGIMQTTFTNSFTGEALKLTTAKIFWPNGKCIHDVALSAKDGCTLVPAQWTATKNDEELQKVVEIIKSR